MATEKQIAANRRNALRSTGPRTPEGKAISSRNAAKYDLDDRRFILSSECPERYEIFRQHFYNEYKPATPTETALVDIMATARWRLIRMAGFEATLTDHESRRGNFDTGMSALAEADGAPLTLPVMSTLSYRRAADSGRSIEMMNRTESRLPHQFNGALDRLSRSRRENARLRAFREEPSGREETDQPPRPAAPQE